MTQAGSSKLQSTSDPRLRCIARIALTPSLGNAGMEFLSFLLCFLFRKHSADERGYCRHCGVKAREER
jgi:hypothetical protein